MMDAVAEKKGARGGRKQNTSSAIASRVFLRRKEGREEELQALGADSIGVGQFV